MSVIEIVSLALVGLFLLVAVVRLFRKPLKLALRVVLNSALGLGVLWLLNSTAPVGGNWSRLVRHCSPYFPAPCISEWQGYGGSRW